MLTTALELTGSALIISGFAVAFGLGAALLAAGAVSIGLSWVLTTRGGSRP